jgi:succinyl-CoA synthetase alpha subunit
VISVNGLFAAREARQALQNGLNVMLFSDNVSLEDELALKQLAHEKGLLLMGPDCGTAIINGTGLCFATRYAAATSVLSAPPAPVARS